jgi:Zn-dependent membrane protease YugP
MFFFDPYYLLFLSPALLLAFWAQYRVRSTYAEAERIAAPLSGAAAARHILDSAGLQNVDIEMIPGQLSDHYDPRARVLRLSEAVYQGRSLAAVGIAAHESGHALQDARHYAPLVIRNAAVPVAGFGSKFSFILLFIGLMLSVQVPLVGQWLVLGGLALFGAVVFFQLVNLPVEFNASSRAKVQLVELGIVSPQEMVYVNRVLDAAALTYVAATLQALLTLLYYILRFSGGRRSGW